MEQRHGGPNTGPGRLVLNLAEEDYRYGTGTLRLVVEQVQWSTPHHDDGELWYEVGGVEITNDGRTVGPRTALVRARRLRALRNTGRHMQS